MEYLEFIALVSTIIGGINALMSIFRFIYKPLSSKKKNTPMLKLPKKNTFFIYKIY